MNFLCTLSSAMMSFLCDLTNFIQLSQDLRVFIFDAPSNEASNPCMLLHPDEFGAFSGNNIDITLPQISKHYVAIAR